MIVVAVALALLIGLSLGLLGGGGSTLTLPILTYVAGMETRSAIAASLFVVGVTSVTGAIAHFRAGRIQCRVGLAFGAAGMLGAYLGGRAAAGVPATILVLGFAAMMVATGIVMLRGRRGGVLGPRQPPTFARVAALGGAVGLVTGAVGAGGGFAVVPALVLVGGLAMPQAVATSLVVIAMQAFAGLAGHLDHVDVDWPLTLAVAASAVTGGLAGVALADRVPPEHLRSGFAWLVLAMAALTIVKQLTMV